MIKLSILIVSLPERSESLNRLFKRLDPQLQAGVEVLVLTDNRKRSTGAKRNAILSLAQGRYVTFIDDDDLVSEDFVSSILDAQEARPAVITYNSKATLNGGNPFLCFARLDTNNEQVRQVNGIWQSVTRSPWHWCAWRSDVALKCKFSDNHIDDDWFWLKQAIPLARADFNPEVHIDKALHFYQYDSTLSLAHQGKSSTDGTL